MNNQINIGDRIKFTVLTRYGKFTAVRKVNGTTHKNNELLGVSVKFQGYNDFYIKLHEIKGVI